LRCPVEIIEPGYGKVLRHATSKRLCFQQRAESEHVVAAYYSRRARLAAHQRPQPLPPLLDPVRTLDGPLRGQIKPTCRKRPAHALHTAAGAVADLVGAGDHREDPVAEVEQMLGQSRRGGLVVETDIGMGRARIVNGGVYEGNAALFHELVERGVVQFTFQHKPVHACLYEVPALNQFQFQIIFEQSQEDIVAALPATLLQRRHLAGAGSIVDSGNDRPDGVRLAHRQRPCRTVPDIAELAHSVLDAHAYIRPNAGRIVEEARHGGCRDTGRQGYVANAREPANLAGAVSCRGAFSVVSRGLHLDLD